MIVNWLLLLIFTRCCKGLSCILSHCSTQPSQLTTFCYQSKLYTVGAQGIRTIVR